MSSLIEEVLNTTGQSKEWYVERLNKITAMGLRLTELQGKQVTRNIFPNLGRDINDFFKNYVWKCYVPHTGNTQFVHAKTKEAAIEAVQWLAFDYVNPRMWMFFKVVVQENLGKSNLSDQEIKEINQLIANGGYSEDEYWGKWYEAAGMERTNIKSVSKLDNNTYNQNKRKHFWGFLWGEKCA